MTDHPLVAQTYIPDWPGKSLITIQKSQLKERVRPGDNSFIWSIAQTLGASAEISKKDISGRALIWRDTGRNVTNQDVVNHLISLGYESESEYNYQAWVKTQGAHQPVIKSATPYGRLVLIDPFPDLKVMDMSEGEGDLTDLQYHKVDTFQGAFQKGYQAVKIDDFCQCPSRGNVGHQSWGLSVEAAKDHYLKGRMIAIAATHRNFSNYQGDLVTPDLLDWHFGQVVRALIRGEDVPVEVTQAHKDKLEALCEGDPNQRVLAHFSLNPDDLAQIDEVLDEGLVAQFQDSIQRAEAIDLVLTSTLSIDHQENRAMEAALREACKREGVLIPVKAYVPKLDGSPALNKDLRKICEEFVHKQALRQPQRAVIDQT